MRYTLSMMIDSAAWNCAKCGGLFIGDEPPGHVCPHCLAASITASYSDGA